MACRIYSNDPCKFAWQPCWNRTPVAAIAGVLTETPAKSTMARIEKPKTCL